MARLPTARTLSNWLKQFTQTTLAPLVELNHDLVVEALAACRLPRLTIDVDSTVVCTGAQVQWAFRGLNPHHRKHLSHYPLLAHVAQTGHKQLAAEWRDWTPLAPRVTGFEHRLTIPQWRLDLRVMIHRKHVRHESRKNFQLDLFTPEAGHFEYYAVATNMALRLPALCAFVCGCGAQEKRGVIFLWGVVPTEAPRRLPWRPWRARSRGAWAWRTTSWCGAESRLIRCPACDVTNRVPEDKLARELRPVYGWGKTPLAVDERLLGSKPVTETEDELAHVRRPDPANKEMR